MIYLYLYQYLLLWDVSYIVENGLMSTSQCNFNHVNPFSHSWDISRQSFYSYWWSNISVVCCCFCTSHIYIDSVVATTSPVTNSGTTSKALSKWSRKFSSRKIIKELDKEFLLYCYPIYVVHAMTTLLLCILP